MAIPPELQKIVAQAKRQYPQLAHLPDEVVAQMISEAMQEQQAGPLAGSEELEKMSAKELNLMGQRLLNMGRWDEAERYFLCAVERAEQENDSEQQTWATAHLARLCRYRGDFPQAMALYQQALVLAEQIGDRRSMGVICDGLGTTYAMCGMSTHRLPIECQRIVNFCDT
jgi:tetratricopeptide (TPR) repeat protein